MRTYSLGTETVPVALSGELTIGSVHDGKAYKIMLARLDGEEIKAVKFISGEGDWEGHSIAKLKDGYLIGGAAEGVATPEGGNGWKAYVARLDEGLNVTWKKKLKLLGNEAVYAILPSENGAFIAGETSGGKGRGFFAGKITLEGESLWLRKLGPWSDAVISGLVELDGRLFLIGSVKGGRWKVKAFEFTGNGELVGKREFAEGVAFTAVETGGKIVLGGYKGKDLWVWGGDWEVTLPNGAATSILPIEDSLLVGGEVEGKAAVIKVKDGEILWEKKLWERGWIEVLGTGVALGVKVELGKTVMVAESLK